MSHSSGDRAMSSLTLVLMGGGAGGGELILSTFYRIISIVILRGVWGYGLGDTKTVDVPVNGYILTCEKNPTNLLFVSFSRV